MSRDVIDHYDRLICEGNDPVLDPPELRAYMDLWDGQLFLDMLHLNSDARVLEIGCGTGRLAVRVAPVVKHFFGIDISPKTVAKAKVHLPYDHVCLICDDFLEHTFDVLFDVIYASLTFLHIQDKEKAFAHVAELLAPGGRFVLSIGKDRAERLVYGERSLPIYPDAPESVIAHLTKNGLTHVTVRESEFAYIVAATRREC